MGLSTVVWLLNPDAVQIYTNMPRDPRRAAGIDCSREGLSGAKLMFFFFFTAYFRKNVFFEVKKKKKGRGIVLSLFSFSPSSQPPCHSRRTPLWLAPSHTAASA